MKWFINKMASLHLFNGPSCPRECSMKIREMKQFVSLIRSRLTFLRQTLYSLKFHTDLKAQLPPQIKHQLEKITSNVKCHNLHQMQHSGRLRSLRVTTFVNLLLPHWTLMFACISQGTILTTPRQQRAQRIGLPQSQMMILTISGAQNITPKLEIHWTHTNALSSSVSWKELLTLLIMWEI